MSKMVTIEKEKLECLRRHLDEAYKIFEGLGVREQKAPKLSPKKQRINKWMKRL